MTANVLQEDVQQYFIAGMDAYVSKPFEAEDLLQKMDAVMGTAAPVGNKKKEVKPQPAAALPPLPDKVTDMQFLKQFTGGKPEKMHKYIGMFLENAPKLLESIDKGLATNDYPSIKIAAHSLKPQLSYMGVKEDVSKIFLIEQSAGQSAHFDTLPLLVSNLKRLCDKAFEELKSYN
jgi:HPt (histidine-containing phosphotransfer) domain-containing protein